LFNGFRDFFSEAREVSDSHSQTNFLNKGFQGGDSDETERLAALIIAELHKIAKADAKKNPAAWQGLELHDVVAEIFLRFKAAGEARKDQAEAAEAVPGPKWSDRKHFYCAAAKAIRRLRIDYARRRKDMHLDSKISLDDPKQAQSCDDVAQAEQLLCLDEALAKLAEVDPEAAEAIELYYFGVRLPDESGSHPSVPASSPSSRLTYEQIGELIGKSKATVCLRIRRGQDWLSTRLGGGSEEDRP
jgi:RNA polymerase sigma factor (sigma-70 family)